MKAPRLPIPIQGLSALICFVVYLTTICPSVYLGDSGELATAAACLGIPHNSGYPLYALLGKVFCLLPFGNIGFRMNLMSSFFASMTVWITCAVIFRITSSRVASVSGALVLGFTPVFWSQSVSAEVYTLHVFFVALLLRVLLWWDENRGPCRLLVVCFLSGISFCNHLQTVMLAPGILYFLLSGDRRSLLRPSILALLSLAFLLALSLYLYLPIRTNAGAALAWGEPDSLGRFLAHVTGRAHREAYALNMAWGEYLERAREILRLVTGQFGALLFLSLWGWVSLPSRRKRLLFLLIVLLDFFYSNFLNTIGPKYTAFNLSTSVVLAVLTGVGMDRMVKWGLRVTKDSGTVGNLIRGFCIVVPVIPFLMQYRVCDLSRNYTAYEHALNMERTLDQGNTLFLQGDNNLFPVLYGRIAEGMFQDVVLYDRHNIVFKMPYLGDSLKTFHGNWQELRAMLETEIVARRLDQGLFYAMFDPRAVILPQGFTLNPFGLLYRVVKGGDRRDLQEDRGTWAFYARESFFDTFERDYLTRQVCAHFHYMRGIGLFLTGDRDMGGRFLRSASRIGYDDTGIHALLVLFFSDQGLFTEARRELEIASRYHEDPGSVPNLWGYYHYRRGDFPKAIGSFRRAATLDPENPSYPRNLALALYKAGRRAEALQAFGRSLALNGDQPEIRRFIEEHLSSPTPFSVAPDFAVPLGPRGGS
ncbi:MAG: DUF2723 domain-containing protein [Deltaproteobacteria bacterium]|nr:DUF2723 domain-containing protein [Deltaproteobacteria bacterium]